MPLDPLIQIARPNASQALQRQKADQDGATSASQSGLRPRCATRGGANPDRRVGPRLRRLGRRRLNEDDRPGGKGDREPRCPLPGRCGQSDADQDACRSRGRKGPPRTAVGVEPCGTQRGDPHPALVRKYETKVARLREALNDELVRVEAASTLRSLIGTVAVHVERDDQALLEVEASTATLIDFAKTTKAHGRSLFPGGVRLRWLRGQDLNL